MTASRRAILKYGALCGALTAAAAGRNAAAQSAARRIAPESVAACEPLFGVTYTPAERMQLVAELEASLGQIARLRDVDKPNSLAPALVFDPRLPGVAMRAQADRFEPAETVSAALPRDSAAVAFAPALRQAAWLREGRLTSRRLTEIYLERIEGHAARLECFVTVTPELALAQADAADRALARDGPASPLHGVPFGLKDIVDTAGVRTTWGAAPYRERVAASDAAAVRRLEAAGAVLLGKTTSGAIAYGDIWFGGQTRNPWNTDEGSSGSSAGSAAAVAAGLCGFAIGTETVGSIVSPADRCGTAGLRPTFGRVSRAGAMSLAWSLDKIGPLSRGVEDTAAVLAVLNGYDANDAGSIDVGFEYDGRADVRALRVGYDAAWFERAGAPERAALDAVRALGVELGEFTLPALPYDLLIDILYAEAAAAFEELTLSNRDDELVWQADEAWPSTWRAARFISAVDLVQLDRLRRRAMSAVADAFAGFDAVIGPSFDSGMLVATNFTGHPSLTLRAGFVESPTRTLFDEPADDGPRHRVPRSITLWAPLFEEGRLVGLGRALERELGVAAERPAAFAA